MRTGILGGTFDPIHSGHVQLALAALKQLGLDRVLLLPSGEPPYKKPFAGRADRLTMARRAVDGLNGIEVCESEILRPGPTYTADTLRTLHARYPGDELIYILGSDAAARVSRWKNADEARRLCRFACVVRAGAQEGVPEGMLRLEADIADISSEAIRSEIASGGAATGSYPSNVEKYIAARGLYLAAMPESEIISDLQRTLKPGRFRHTLGVMETSVELARIYGAPEGKALYAALLHDCAKNLSEGELMELAEISGADADEMACPPVMHAPVGAHLAHTRYGVRDAEVLSAIRRHTVGAEDMSLLDAIVYVADMVEPGRRFFPGLDDARNLARRDIFSAAALCGRLTREYNRGKGALHPMTEKMIKCIENGGFANG